MTGAGLVLTYDRPDVDLVAIGTALEDPARFARVAATVALGAARIPRRTGALAAGAHVEATPDGAALSSSVPYFPYVHAVNPFFTRALDTQTAHIETAIAQAIETTLESHNG